LGIGSWELIKPTPWPAGTLVAPVGTLVADDRSKPGGRTPASSPRSGAMLYAAVLMFLIVVALAAVFGGVAALPAVFVLLIFAAAIYLMINSRNLRRPPDTRA